MKKIQDKTKSEGIRQNQQNLQRRIYFERRFQNKDQTNHDHNKGK
jgi:hypothetical protein